MGDCACDRNRMPNVFAEFNAVALDLPSAPFLRCQQVFVGAVTVLKAACESPGAFVGGFCRRVVLRVASTAVPVIITNRIPILVSSVKRGRH